MRHLETMGHFVDQPAGDPAVVRSLAGEEYHRSHVHLHVTFNPLFPAGFYPPQAPRAGAERYGKPRQELYRVVQFGGAPLGVLVTRLYREKSDKVLFLRVCSRPHGRRGGKFARRAVPGGGRAFLRRPTPCGTGRKEEER